MTDRRVGSGMKPPRAFSVTKVATAVCLAAPLALATGCGQTAHPTDVAVGRSGEGSSCADSELAFHENNDAGTPIGHSSLRFRLLTGTVGSGECPGMVVVKDRDRVYSTAVPSDRTYRPRAGRAFSLGRDRIVALPEAAVRGGTQWHVYTLRDGRLMEWLTGGSPAITFRASDVRTTRLTSTCTRRVLSVIAANMDTVRPGTWDVRLTKLSSDATTSFRQVGQSLSEAELATRFPTLARQRMFAGCRL